MQMEMISEILPKPNEQIIQKEEKMWGIKLPSDYRQFLLKTNGGVPQKREFIFDDHGYRVVSFLGILENTEHNEFGFYDIDVVLSQIEERLTDNEDLVGCELLPIAELFAGIMCAWISGKAELRPIYAFGTMRNQENLSR